MVKEILGVILSIGIAQAGNTLITKVDSSGNQYTLYGNTHESIDFANGYVLVVNRGFDSTNILHVHSSPDQGKTWINNGTAYKGMIGGTAYKACYPTIYGGEDGPYVFFPYASDTNFAGMAVIRGIGWGDSIIWGEPKRIGFGMAPPIAVGKQLENGNVMMISVAPTLDTMGGIAGFNINYNILSSDLDTVISNGRVLDTLISRDGWFEGWDCKGGRIAGSIWFNPSSHGYFSSDDYGETWNRYRRQKVVPDSTVFGEAQILIPQRHSQVAFREDSIPIYVGAVAPGDSSIEGIGTGFWYYSGEIYACPAESVVQPIQVSKSLYHRALFPSVATGGGKIVVAWLEYTDSIIDKDSDNNKTDIFYSVSEDGGYTWSEPENLTNTPDIIECWPRLAKRIDTLNHKAYVLYATSYPDQDLDIERLTIMRGFQFEQPIYINVAVIDLAPPPKVQEPSPEILKDLTLYPIQPNPSSDNVFVSYYLPVHTQVSLKVYNSVGMVVKTLVDKNQNAGYKTIAWDGRDNKGRPLPKGVYFCELKALGSSKRAKLILLH